MVAVSLHIDQEYQIAHDSDNENEQYPVVDAFNPGLGGLLGVGPCLVLKVTDSALKVVCPCLQCINGLYLLGGLNIELRLGGYLWVCWAYHNLSRMAL